MTLKFELYCQEVQNYTDWLREHDDKCKERHEYHGAIHIGDTFQFTQNSVGRGVKVICVCGEEKDITDYDCW